MNQEDETRSWREAYEEYCKEHISPDSLNLQNVFTPYSLCGDMVHRLQVYCPSFKDLRFGIFNLEFADVLMYDYGVSANQITFITDCKSKGLFAESERYSGINIEVYNYMDLLNDKAFAKEKNMKFDVIIANYPFQTKSDEKNKKTQPIWHKFVEKSFELCKDGGFIAAIHPSGWRDVDGMFSGAKTALQQKDIKFLSIHNADDGVKTFGCGTRYDWYITKNAKKSNAKTIIECEDGSNIAKNINNIPFIPNCKFDEIMGLIAKDGEQKVDLLWNCKYHTQARVKDGTMNAKESKTFKYPCIQHVGVSGDPTCTWYSSTNANGHFGIPKVIFSSKQVGGLMIDRSGEYAMCQDCSAIIAPVKELALIKKAMESASFIELMAGCDVGGNRDRYPRKIISTFRKDFWRSFIDENGNGII